MRLAFAIMLAACVLISAPVSAHKKHKNAEEQQTTLVQNQPEAVEASAAAQPGTPSGAEHGTMGERLEHGDEDRSSPHFAARLLDWLGRLHPIIVHFPIAFFPGAFFTALVGRRRPAFAAPVQFLVVAGGILAPLAAILGWIDAIGADPDRLLSVHRWLGTAIGAGGLGLAVWAWRKPEQVRSAGMLASLAAITTMLVLQGWLGGALVHGIDHLNW